LRSLRWVVDDLQKSLEFYRVGLGLPTDGIVGQEFEHGKVVFIVLQAGLKLVRVESRGTAADRNGNPRRSLSGRRRSAPPS
jgi:hypothetical protein